MIDEEDMDMLTIECANCTDEISYCDGNLCSVCAEEKALIEEEQRISRMTCLTIDDLHKQNNAFIKKHNLKVGDTIYIINKYCKLSQVVVTHIHSLYGWITAQDNRGWEAYNIDVRNITDVIKR